MGKTAQKPIATSVEVIAEHGLRACNRYLKIKADNGKILFLDSFGTIVFSMGASEVYAFSHQLSRVATGELSRPIDSSPTADG